MKQILILILLTTFFFSCKKNDQALTENKLPAQSEEEELERRNNSSRCDYEEALSNAVGPDHSEVLPLFKKYYNGSGKLNKVHLNFLDPPGPSLSPFDLNVSHQYRKMIFTYVNGDTAIVLNFDRAGRVISSMNAGMNFLHFGGGSPGTDDFEYREYIYHNGRLKQINTGHITWDSGSEDPADTYDTAWSVETKLEYDWKKNPSRIIFPGSSVVNHEFIYKYDYRKKGKSQFYADQRLPRFFYFLKYLNIFHELNPENILVAMERRTTEYPGNDRTVYIDHKFDHQGKLISYRRYNILLEQNKLQEPFFTEKWYIKWKCNNHGHRH